MRRDENENDRMANKKNGGDTYVFISSHEGYSNETWIAPPPSPAAHDCTAVLLRDAHFAAQFVVGVGTASHLDNPDREGVLESPPSVRVVGLGGAVFEGVRLVRRLGHFWNRRAEPQSGPQSLAC